MVPTRTKRRTIAIAGAGIGGLTAALTLQSKGFKVLVLEKTETPATQGAGIQVSPNALNVLDAVNVGRLVRQSSSIPDAINIRNANNGKFLTAFELGESFKKRHGLPYLVLHRADLLQALLAQCEMRGDIEIRTGHEVFDLAQHANGVTLLTKHLDEMIEVQTAALIAADGVWSRLRHFVPNSADPRATGKIAWRSLVPMDRVPAEIETANTNLWLASNMHVVHYPIRSERYLNIVCIVPGVDGVQPEGWVSGTKFPMTSFDVRQIDPSLKELLETAESWGGWPIYQMPKIGDLSHDRLCLLGDAAHAMVPYAAQGGACAVEDAAVLAANLSTDSDLAQGFAAYSKQRKQRLRNIQRLALANGRIYHMSPPLSKARDLAMVMVPQEAIQRRMDWLYNWRG